MSQTKRQKQERVLLYWETELVKFDDRRDKNVRRFKELIGEPNFVPNDSPRRIYMLGQIATLKRKLGLDV